MTKNDAVLAVLAASNAVTDWYDRNDEAKANRRNFPTTEELSKLNAALRETVRRWRMYREDGGCECGAATFCAGRC